MGDCRAIQPCVVGDAAEDVLESINSHAITHLAVPDGPPNPAEHRFKEPAAAFDRLERCFVFEPSGRVARRRSIPSLHRPGVRPQKPTSHRLTAIHDRPVPIHRQCVTATKFFGYKARRV
jgi:hypothetical protein